MYRILKKETYSPSTYMWVVEAPDIAAAARAGQFVIVCHNETAERIPLTIADFDVEAGTITLVVQAVGKSTIEMMTYNEGDHIRDLVGPLGEASHIEPLETVVFVGGGLGVAPVYPILREFKLKGSHTISILGFRTREIMFWQERFARYSDELIITTDDGSCGEKGLVTVPLQRLISRRRVDHVVAIGPLIMMRACAEVTRPHGIPTVVSLNPIMVDGTGMCGSCRVTVGDEVKFSCIDGPDMDGHLVNFDELMNRQKRFDKYEKVATKKYGR
ncbi:oxidoreductase FAD/NAD(P)-binding domain-containing protein [Candidatus Magnetobacterium bavaricum]|uniref:Oxidoreductase FAD/NAD(P)-binding domain-containing protein n=1 Tax=Candidatus Magnetobacterium bavaricum TaxID=29290 RepID=A0A0F3GXI1_9BACT|nr:oxidoreductase FAD/NAD(P)-binding domain-containing protein [Candidatus Magnetobacterium bavaricum]